MKMNMLIVNLLEAKSSLSLLVDAVERGTQTEIAIARNGRPAARLVPVQQYKAGQRLGVAKGRFLMPKSIDNNNANVARLFNKSRGLGPCKSI